MIFTVTHSAFIVTGLARAVTQLSKPVRVMSPSPFQLVKLRKITPTSGMTAKITKKTSAGAANQPREAALRLPWAGRVDRVSVSRAIYLPSVPFIVSANCSGVISPRKMRSRLASIALPCSGLSAWSQESWKLGAPVAMP